MNVLVAGSHGQVSQHATRLLVDEAKAQSIEQFVMLSPITADRLKNGPEELREYLRTDQN